MSTTFYLRSTADRVPAAPCVPTDSGVFRDLLTTSITSGATFPTRTVQGPVSNPQASAHVTLAAGGAPITWVSPPLVGFTCSGSILVAVSAMESSTAANVGRIWARIGRLTPDGTYTWFATAILALELTTTQTTYTASATPTATVFADGDRLVAELYLDDASGYTMAAGLAVNYYETPGLHVTLLETVTVINRGIDYALPTALVLGADMRASYNPTITPATTAFGIDIYLANQHAVAFKMRAVIWTHGGNAGPTTLLGYSDEVTIAASQAAGWVTFPFSTPVSIASGATVQLGWNADENSAGLAVYRGSAAGYSIWYNADDYTDGPAPDASGSLYYSNYGMSEYISRTTPPAPILAAAQAGAGVNLSWT